MVIWSDPQGLLQINAAAPEADARTGQFLHVRCGLMPTEPLRCPDSPRLHRLGALTSEETPASEAVEEKKGMSHIPASKCLAWKHHPWLPARLIT